MMAAMQGIADRVAAQGRSPYIIPGGASNEIGALGYVSCAEEILRQTIDEGIPIDRVVCASGSTGTHAGLLTGLFGNNSQIPVIGINVSRTKEAQEKLVYELVEKVAAKVGIESPIPKEAVVCFDDYVGSGYSLPTDSMIEAVRMLAETEAILMDPVYTGKAIAGLIDLVRKGFFDQDEKILFIHTGGSPALHVYADCFLGA
jgi:D-cysteine desulfhydrase